MSDVVNETEAVTGDLKNFSIFDITHTLMMSRKTALVTIQRDNKKGYVYFSEGQIVHALDDDLNTGERAAFKIFFWRGGLFNIEFDAAPREKNIQLDTENLLLEIARNMDESERDNLIKNDGSDASAAVEEKFEDRFKNELTRVFDKLDRKTAPSRERYTVSAFDTLLIALNDLSGTALFLRPNSRPRIKTRNGFTTIKQEVIQAGEIQGFLNSLLSANEQSEFDAHKEISVYYSSEEAGTFQVRAFFDSGRPACIFSPASRSIPPVSRLPGDGPTLAEIFAETGGLWLITGPLGSGKTTVLASLLEQGLRDRDFLVTLFAKTQTFEFSDECGFMIRAGLDRFTLDARGSIAAAIDQGSDVIAVDEIAEAGMFRDAVAVAARTSLVLAVVESEGLADLADRVRRFAGESDSRALKKLSTCLRGVLDMDLADGKLRKIVVTDEQRSDIALGRLDALDLVPA